MRIIYLTSNINPFDGTGTFSRGLIMAARRAGHEPVVLLPERYKGDVELEPGFAATRVLPSQKVMADSNFKTWLAARRISRLAGARQAAVVHCLFERYAPLAQVLARGLGVPYVVSAVGSYALEGFERRKRLAGRYREAFESAACVAAISRYTASLLQPHAPESKIEVVYPGIDTPAQTDPSSRREPFILSVGALKPRKGQDIQVKAFALLSDEFPKWRLVLVGESNDDELVAQLHKIIKSQGLENRVDFRGRVTQAELMGLYQQAGVFALAPRADGWKMEGYGLVFLEAAAWGLPLVCTQECGFAEHMRGHEFGIMAENDTPEGLREALVPLLRDAALREKAGRAAAAFARGRTWDAAFHPFVAIYERACQPQ